MRDDDGDEEEYRRRDEHAAHQGLELAELLVDGKAGQLVAEGVREGGNGNREEVRELGERLDGAEFGWVDVLRDKPQPDDRVQEICRAAGAEEHERVPPEVAEAGVEFVEHLQILDQLGLGRVELHICLGVGRTMYVVGFV